MRVYVFGNGNLSFADFLTHYRVPLTEWIDPTQAEFIVCDFRGVDTLTMELLKQLSANVRVFHIGERPRYLPDRYRTKVSSWELVGGFEDDRARDEAAIAACTHFLAVDFNSNAKRKSGTTTNIARCLALGKLPLRPPEAEPGPSC